MDVKPECQKNGCFSIISCWRRPLGSPLDCEEVKSVNPKEINPEIFTGKTDAETEAPATRREKI